MTQCISRDGGETRAGLSKYVDYGSLFQYCSSCSIDRSMLSLSLSMLSLLIIVTAVTAVTVVNSANVIVIVNVVVADNCGDCCPCCHCSFNRSLFLKLRGGCRDSLLGKRVLYSDQDKSTLSKFTLHSNGINLSENRRPFKE